MSGLVKVNVTPLNILLAAIVGYVALKGVTGWALIAKGISGAIDSPMESIADSYVEATNPLVKPQIKIRSAYMDEGYTLYPEAKAVYMKFPKIYALVFNENGTVRPDALGLVDNGVFYTESNLPIIGN